jgi:hypothetical protein
MPLKSFLGEIGELAFAEKQCDEMPYLQVEYLANLVNHPVDCQ